MSKLKSEKYKGWSIKFEKGNFFGIEGVRAILKKAKLSGVQMGSNKEEAFKNAKYIIDQEEKGLSKTELVRAWFNMTSPNGASIMVQTPKQIKIEADVSDKISAGKIKDLETLRKLAKKYGFMR